MPAKKKSESVSGESFSQPRAFLAAKEMLKHLSTTTFNADILLQPLLFGRPALFGPVETKTF